jgi:amino acid adenylation domain-containing protein/thioester reductase-like protein
LSLASKDLADLSSSEKRALLVKLLDKKRNELQSFPLSFTQEAIWFFEQLQPGSSLYNMPAAFRVTGRIDIGVTEQVVNEIVKRHEVIRAAFSDANGEPRQRIAPTLSSLPIRGVDLRALQGWEQEEEVRRLVEEEVQRPFDLNRAPLLRFTLVRLGEEEYVVLAVMHHIICDGWSLRVFFREMFALYQAFSCGRPSPLPELPIQYTDFVVWQRQWIQGEIFKGQLKYWKEQLTDLPALQLPTDRSRPAVQSFRGGTENFIVPDNLSESLKSLSRREGATLFMTLLAAFQALLYRYTGQEDMVVGTATAGRKRAEFEQLIGVFANALVLRTDMSGNPTFRELLQRVRLVCQAAYAHDDVPFEKLVEALRPKRDLRWTPLFRVMFRVIPSLPAMENPSIAVTPLEGESEATGFDLSLSVMDRGNCLRGSLLYSTDLFEAPSVQRMVVHFLALLEAIVRDPDARLLSLRCLGADEERRFREKRNLLTQRAQLTAVQEMEGVGNLTGDQLAIWTGQKLQPDAPLYNLAALITISEKIELKHFQSAFQTLVNSSDAMRTVIEEKDGLPQRTIVPDFSYTMEYLDFSLALDPDAKARNWAHKRCQISFDLGTRLFDSALIKLSEKKFVWYLCQHHMITDGWSVRLIFDWMAELYKHSVQGGLAEKVQLPPYQNYVDYERQHRRSSNFLRVKSYWEKKLKEDMEPIVFYGKPALIKTTDVHRVALELGIERTQKLQAVAAQQGVPARTMDGALLNIFAALLCTYLYRISDKRRIVLGVPFHNRRSKAFKETIGLFVEVLPIHVIIDEDDTFLSLLRKVKDEVFATLRHSPYAISNSRQKKIYDVVLNYHTMSRSNYNGAPIQVEAVHTGHGNDAFGLRMLDFSESGNLTLEFDFHRDVFDDRLQSQAIKHFLHVLDAYLEDPDQLLNQISLLTIEENQRLLVEFNQTEVPLPEKLTIVDLFEVQVARAPGKIAIVFEEQRLTYQEVNSRANQLARYLRELGVGPEVLVAVSLERSVEMVVGLLAVLKAGGAYLPLDPDYPKDRLAFMLEDAQPRVLLTQQRVVRALMVDGGSKRQDGDSRLAIKDSQIHVVCLDSDLEGITKQDDENLVSLVTGENLAYVIYTSGSTGSPKGSMNTHKGICNRLVWMQEAYRLTEEDRVLQKTPFSFDVSVWEFFWPLISGASLVVARPGGHQDRDYLVKLITEQGITTLHFVPSMLRIFLEAKGLEACGCLRRVICSGEALSWELQERFFVRLGAELHNLYGPTEAAVDVTSWACKRQSERKVVPIGRPIANTRIYILDPRLRPVPIGVAGELHIGGVGLARGYLNRPDLTAEKFISSPFRDDPGARLYKTGDLARYLPDGNIEFLGRLDHQVKIRGFRIELEEVESALAQHAAVREVVVMAREDRVGEKPLVAYVVARQELTPTAGELRSYLKEKLPEFMVPSAFVLLEAMPLTANGKVNRKALPTPDHTRYCSLEHYVAPRNQTEEVLAGICAQLIGIESVGIHDNFFELGGHSLLGAQFVSRVQEAFHVEVPLRKLFELPTVAELAEAIENALRESSTRRKQPTPAGDLDAEAVLDFEVCAKLPSAENVTDPAHVLLTGSTGFLGAYLLYELIQQTQATIHCLVRSRNAEEARTKVLKSLQAYSLWNESFGSRIVPVSGDLSKPSLGISPDIYEALAGKIDVIYHNGALVNFLFPYSAFKASNVQGTREILKLASQVKHKPVHYVSTVDVFGFGEASDHRVVLETDRLAPSGSLVSGYAQSKWVAEKLVTMAGETGLPVSIYRPGVISGHSQTGTWNPNDLLWSVFRASIRLGRAPDLDLALSLTPVDYVSRALIHLSKQKEFLGQTFHVVNPNPIQLSELVNTLRSFGYELAKIPYRQWLSELMNLVGGSREDPLYLVLPLIAERFSEERIKIPRFDCRNTLNGLAGTSIICPPVDDELLGTYFSYFIRSRLLQAASVHGEVASNGQKT